MPNLKILHVIASVNPADGGPIAGILSQELSSKHAGTREIVSLDSSIDPFLKDFPVKVYPLGPDRSKRPNKAYSHLKRFGFTTRLIPWLRINAKNYDAVIVNGLWNYASVGSSLVLPRLGVPYFVFTHGMMDPWFRKINPLKHALKQIFWLVFEGRLLMGAKAVLFTTKEEALLAQREYWGYSYRSETVGYGAQDLSGCLQPKILLFREAFPAINTRSYILFLGRIHPKKGCDLLISAFSRIAETYPDIDLVMAGPDQIGWGAKLKKISQDLQIESRVHWIGMLDGDLKWGALGGALAFVLPSHQENFGIAVAEAMACGTPVLISDKVNIWREVKVAEAGIVCQDNTSSLIDALKSYLSLSESQIAKMRLSARNCFENNFNMSKVSQNILDTICRYL